MRRIRNHTIIVVTGALVYYTRKMTDTTPVWKYPYFSEFEIKILYPDLPYLSPGDQVTDGVVVRDFDELGPQPRIFRIEDEEIVQLLPVRITDEDGTVTTDIWSANISFMTPEEIAAEENRKDDPEKD